MRALLLHLDGKLPNLALMRIAAHHRSLGDDVELRRPQNPRMIERGLWDAPDRVYASLVFRRTIPLALRLKEVYPDAILGGTGWDRRVRLEQVGIETPNLDYSVYPGYAHSIGFTQRGCRMSCEFCVVPAKEGRPRPETSVRKIWRGEPWPRHLLLLDNDFGGLPGWRENARQIIEGEFKVCFCQGINARLLNEELAEALGAMKCTDDDFKERRIYTAWDSRRDEKILFRGLNWLVAAGFRPDDIMVYMLIGYWPNETVEDWEYRRGRLRDFGCRPFPMAYIDSTTTPDEAKLRHGFQRWVIRRDDLKMSWAEFMGAGFRPEKVRRCAELPILEVPMTGERVSPYGHHWRTVLRPETLARDCYECVRCGVGDRPRGLRTALEVAHLDGDVTNNAPENRATLCNTCHKAHDHEAWWPKFQAWLLAERERKIDAADARRPILEYLREAV